MINAHLDTPENRAEFKRRFQHMHCYTTEARQADLYKVFLSGMQHASTREDKP